ncbi:hypothetical protein Glove_648g10 [Diversispora epigaea]|uniref:Uncharacterized protein n=1 Tax=Diversispora epigaea TaxID=1348612 RepID=A0A397G7H2_9GLOM|nr:hypothetical protein Glove_648g10 [Diversispora epigaea]
MENIYCNENGTTLEDEEIFQRDVNSGGNAAGKTTKDEENAFQWFVKSAEGGNRVNNVGQDSLGNCYQDGIESTKDEEKAFQWYLKSVEGVNSVG